MSRLSREAIRQAEVARRRERFRQQVLSDPTMLSDLLEGFEMMRNTRYEVTTRGALIALPTSPLSGLMDMMTI